MLLSLVALGMVNGQLPAYKNSWTTAEGLVPGFFPGIVLYAVLEAVALALAAPLRLRGKGLPRASFAAFALAAGVFVLKFLFYAMHMTVGMC